LLRRTPIWANGNYVVCDGTGEILDIEATPEGAELVTDQGAGFLAHSNHFVSEKYATRENHAASAADSFPRLERMQQLIRARFGQIRVDDVKQFLRDRAGYPSSICRFARTTDPAASWVTSGITVASLIAEPLKRRMHVAVGNRAETPFVTYEMS
jgi:isopenicillin-N N-acyltransferase-like protein